MYSLKNISGTLLFAETVIFDKEPRQVTTYYIPVGLSLPRSLSRVFPDKGVELTTISPNTFRGKTHPGLVVQPFDSASKPVLVECEDIPRPYQGAVWSKGAWKIPSKRNAKGR